MAQSVLLFLALQILVIREITCSCGCGCGLPTHNPPFPIYEKPRVKNYGVPLWDIKKEVEYYEDDLPPVEIRKPVCAPHSPVYRKPIPLWDVQKEVKVYDDSFPTWEIQKPIFPPSPPPPSVCKELGILPFPPSDFPPPNFWPRRNWRIPPTCPRKIIRDPFHISNAALQRQKLAALSRLRPCGPGFNLTPLRPFDFE